MILTCQRCLGTGEVIACVDDMCRGMGECIHGSYAVCPDCRGSGGEGEEDDWGDDDSLPSTEGQS